jgi:hypothetical protein
MGSVRRWAGLRVVSGGGGFGEGPSTDETLVHKAPAVLSRRNTTGALMLLTAHAVLLACRRFQ